MSRLLSVVKGSYGVLRVYLMILVGLVAIAFFINLLLGIGNINRNSEVSSGNIVTIFLLIISGVLPLYFFKRIINLGASRKEYYFGTIIAYIFWVAAFSVFNIIWFLLEQNVFIEYKSYFNIIEIFGWDRYGVIGMFIYQFSTYLFIVAFFNLVFSCFRDRLALGIYILLAAAISVSMSISSLREAVFKGVAILFFNPTILPSTILTFALIGLLFMAGWFFTTRREIYK
ncbi:hypothetical protein JFL43_03535 [Viridibacillus sp. YIM B01967]|uniref:ABC transporter permease n=1 Tax=Viridibacillus soli TaxID=2798301 RepID=A0ABS1H3F1_9BACL|nr:hypothetical protein [Viridibacillus soli]MBK3493944.1 hypothetical protein [Viridibacillus soli]